jgi:hypothetical protein
MNDVQLAMVGRPNHYEAADGRLVEAGVLQAAAQKKAPL